ncbi:MAG: SDR family oxidoreductase [Microscillaceae bacterium]
MMYEQAWHKQAISDLHFLVTGGAGFIGSHLVEYLVQHQAGQVTILDNLATGYRENITDFLKAPQVRWQEGDIRRLDDCRQACQGVDIVLHQAALGSVPRSVQDPLTSNEVNVNGFLHILTAAREAGVKRVVYAASSSTYGDSQSLPKVEDKIGKPLSPYAVSKYVNELYAEVFSKIYEMEIIGLRYFNVFGPRQSPKGPYAAVIPLFIAAIQQGKSPTIHGDGEQTRDFTFVANAVQANIKAALVKEPSALNQVYNVAAGKRTSLNQLWHLLNTDEAHILPAHYGPARPGDVRDSLADIGKARQWLDYHPGTDIEEGLKITKAWFKSQAS